MPTFESPPALEHSRSPEPVPAVKVMLDLTIYFDGPTLEELEYFFELYESVCPPERLREFKISEIPYWSRIAQPQLTILGRAAAAAGVRRPYFEPVRERIRQGRAFEARYWDGIELDEHEGSWSFTCGRIHVRTKGHFGFMRMLFPMETDYKILRRLACELSSYVSFYSGHGGLVFAYDPSLLEDAFDEIYAKARRFWAVDIESLDDTLPLTRRGIKTVSWITLVGRQYASTLGIDRAITKLGKSSRITMLAQTQATVILAGPRPISGDRNRADDLEAYFEVAAALSPLFLDYHPDFPGDHFRENDNTIRWLRRFIEPAGWLASSHT